MDTTALQEKQVREYIDAYNRFDIERMLVHLHPDVLFENEVGGAVTLSLQGIEAFRTQAQQAATLFSSRHQEITALFTETERVTVAIAYTAVLATDLGPELKKGTTLSLTGSSEFTFQDNRIIHLRDRS